MIFNMIAYNTSIDILRSHIENKYSFIEPKRALFSLTARRQSIIKLCTLPKCNVIIWLLQIFCVVNYGFG